MLFMFIFNPYLSSKLELIQTPKGSSSLTFRIFSGQFRVFFRVVERHFWARNKNFYGLFVWLSRALIHIFIFQLSIFRPIFSVKYFFLVWDFACFHQDIKHLLYFFDPNEIAKRPFNSIRERIFLLELFKWEIYWSS